LRGRPPRAPFDRAAAEFAVDVALPARRATSLAVVIPSKDGTISATEKSISSSGQAIAPPADQSNVRITSTGRGAGPRGGGRWVEPSNGTIAAFRRSL
jgi:hypothetical protein